MPLPIGTKLGPYEILAPIGAGGMGEVYRAKDTKLKRDVALKVLPEAFARDPERMARFQREAEVLASLNHPNIAAIYGVEDRALVMEMVEHVDKTHLAFAHGHRIARIASSLCLRQADAICPSLDFVVCYCKFNDQTCKWDVEG
jgi:serine/threonine protein kinase